MKRIAAGATAVVLMAGAGAVVAQPAAAAKKYTACVKKSTGEMRLLLGKSKKCKKGWKKKTWQKAGPTGARGPDGAAGPSSTFGVLVDATGTVIGTSLGVLSVQIGVYSVRIDGGDYLYYANGLLLPSGSPVYFENGSCTGATFAVAADTMERDRVTQDPGLRFVERTSSGTGIGPARAFKSEGTSSSVANKPLWYLNDAGVCTASANFTGYLLPVTPVTAPRDYPGPLRLV